MVIWMEPSDSEIDGSFKYLLVSRAARSMALIFTTLALPLYLKSLGYTLVNIGIVYLLVMAFNAAVALGLGSLGDRIGYKNSLMLGEVLPVVGLSMMAFFAAPAFVIGGAVLSGISAVAGAVRGAFSPGSQAFVARNWNNYNERVRRLGMINAVAASFAIVGGVLLSLQGVIGDSIGTAGSFRLLFGFSSFLMLVSLVSLFGLKERQHVKKETRFMKKSSQSYVAKVAFTNILNGAGLGIAMPLLPLWFSLVYHIGTPEIGALFSLSYAAAAGSTYLSAKTAGMLKSSPLQIGSATRMVQGGMLIAMVAMPTFALAGAVYVLRTAFAAFGMPYRGTVNLSGIENQDYGTGTSIIGVSARFAQLSSGLSGYLMDFLTPAPLVIGGILQFASGVAYFRLLGVKPPGGGEKSGMP